MMTPVCPRLLNLINDFVLLRFRARGPEDLSAMEVILLLLSRRFFGAAAFGAIDVQGGGWARTTKQYEPPSSMSVYSQTFVTEGWGFQISRNTRMTTCVHTTSSCVLPVPGVDYHDVFFPYFPCSIYMYNCIYFNHITLDNSF